MMVELWWENGGIIFYIYTILEKSTFAQKSKFKI